ncbi:hypothetical protein GMOD_00007192 [Pyrenophora seminiperda CCB06]|uniref:Uncharacterized protein n=1 Tax=Pyrenophora seminiperda CCB06 TaxID=1302712 RepID=A0A3M7MCE4_9PLEO|nr:hypothetical protein GMOD_00007192 [Pyrenophora seminiperda CCB06]
MGSFGGTHLLLPQHHLRHISFPARAEYCTVSSSLQVNSARIHDRDEYQDYLPQGDRP